MITRELNFAKMDEANFANFNFGIWHKNHVERDQQISR